MTTIRILTTQNVYIDYHIANIGDRILAAVIDWVTLLGLFWGVSLLFSWLIPTDVYIWIFLLVVFFYDLGFEIFMNGQTIGKRARNIRVVRLDGLQPSIGNYLLRWILRPVDFNLTFFAGALLSILMTPYGQRLGDLAAGTAVIKLDQPATLEDTIFARVDEDYQIVYPQVSALTDDDVTIIKEVLNTAPTLEEVKMRRMIIRKAAEKIAQKMNIPLESVPEQFLETVIRDYNHHHGSL